MPDGTPQKGVDLLIKINTGTDASPTWSTLGGIRSTGLSFNGQSIDVTNADSAGRWRELLPAYGVRSMSLSGDGVFKNGAAQQQLQGQMMAASDATDVLVSAQVIVPDEGTYEGAFLISAKERRGSHEGEVTYSVSLESAGEITFTAES